MVQGFLYKQPLMSRTKDCVKKTPSITAHIDMKQLAPCTVPDDAIRVKDKVTSLRFLVADDGQER
jgi:hypothetical protein